MRDESKPTAARVTAALGLLDRGHGKAPQALTIAGDDDLRPNIALIRMIVVQPGDAMRPAIEHETIS